MSIVEFLRARLDEDEAVAHEAITERRQAYTRKPGYVDQPDYDFTAGVDHPPGIVAVGPERVLREVEAKRRIVEQAEEATGLDMQVDGEFRVGSRDEVAEPYCGDVILCALASVYADHPDYRDEWKP